MTAAAITIIVVVAFAMWAFAPRKDAGVIKTHKRGIVWRDPRQDWR